MVAAVVGESFYPLRVGVGDADGVPGPPRAVGLLRSRIEAMLACGSHRSVRDDG